MALSRKFKVRRHHLWNGFPLTILRQSIRPSIHVSIIHSSICPAWLPCIVTNYTSRMVKITYRTGGKLQRNYLVVKGSHHLKNRRYHACKVLQGRSNFAELASWAFPPPLRFQRVPSLSPAISPMVVQVVVCWGSQRAALRLAALFGAAHKCIMWFGMSSMLCVSMTLKSEFVGLRW